MNAIMGMCLIFHSLTKPTPSPLVLFQITVIDIPPTNLVYPDLTLTKLAAMDQVDPTSSGGPATG
jgi:hypothetical protein